MQMDPKVRNLLVFLAKNVFAPTAVIVAVVYSGGVTDYFRLLGQITIALLLWRVGLSIYRRLILPSKKPLEFGKWAIVTGESK
jgi:hypothetical protein